MEQTLVFYDGVCGLCNRLVRFLLRRDRRGTLRFAPLQGEIARRTLVAAGRDPADLDSVVVIAGWGSARQRVFVRSRAVLHAASRLGAPWNVAAWIAGRVPTGIADRVYAFVARRRYRVFGKYDACPLPPPEWRQRFLE